MSNKKSTQRKPDELKRRNMIGLRLTDSQYQQLKEKADALYIPPNFFVIKVLSEARVWK